MHNIDNVRIPSRRKGLKAFPHTSHQSSNKWLLQVSFRVKDECIIRNNKSVHKI